VHDRKRETTFVPRLLQIMFSRCTDPGRELEFNRWYTHTHLPDLSVAPGFVTARRFRNALPTPDSAPYMAIYEVEADNASQMLADLTRLALEAFDCGRHIDCIEGLPAGTSSLGGQWQEIDPAGLEPLSEHAYPPASPELRQRMLDMIEGLTRSKEAIP
jgi:hypothetical protein